MIKAEQRRGGVSVVIESGLIELLDEFTSIVKAVHTKMAEEFDEEFADMMITMCGQLAYSNDQEEIDRINEMVSGFLDKKAEEFGIDLN